MGCQAVNCSYLCPCAKISNHVQPVRCFPACTARRCVLVRPAALVPLVSLVSVWAPPAASQSAADLSLDALNTAQEEDLLVLKLFRCGACVCGAWRCRLRLSPALPLCWAFDFYIRMTCAVHPTPLTTCLLPSLPPTCVPLVCHRQLWLYCGVYDFAGLKAAASAQHGSSGRWPAEWRQAAGRVAAVSPLLIVGWEQYKPDELLESLTSEFGSRLAKLGPLGESAALTSALFALLGPDLAAPGLKAQLPAPMVCGWGGWAGRALRGQLSRPRTCPKGCPP